jgi:hypothetical protein
MVHLRRGIIITVGNYIDHGLVDDGVILHIVLGAEGLDLCSGNGKLIPRRPCKVEDSITQFDNEKFKNIGALIREWT